MLTTFLGRGHPPPSGCMPGRAGRTYARNRCTRRPSGRTLGAEIARFMTDVPAIEIPATALAPLVLNWSLSSGGSSLVRRSATCCDPAPGRRAANRCSTKGAAYRRDDVDVLRGEEVLVVGLVRPGGGVLASTGAVEQIQHRTRLAIVTRLQDDDGICRFIAAGVHDDGDLAAGAGHDRIDRRLLGHRLDRDRRIHHVRQRKRDADTERGNRRGTDHRRRERRLRDGRPREDRAPRSSAQSHDKPL